MTKLQHFLCGSYFQNGLKLKKEGSDVQLLIRNRKTTTAKKPKHFLLRMDTEKAQYISSLYKNKGKGYNLEYKGIRYNFVQNDTSEGLKIVIEPVNNNADD